jgi:hypothetical protein
MNELTVTAKGQVTLRKDLLTHLGVQPGGGKSLCTSLRMVGSKSGLCGPQAEFRMSLMFSSGGTDVPCRSSKSMKSPDGAGPVGDEKLQPTLTFLFGP